MQLDLNLLTALDALLEENSVTAAAARLHLSTPAMSRTLGRLRRVTGDQVLVRTGRTMTPTPYALAVRGQVHALVGAARAVLEPARALDLAGLDRVFTLQLHDAIASALAPLLVGAVRSRAPLASLRFIAEGDDDAEDLRNARVDLAAGSRHPDAADLRSKVLGHDALVVVMRPQHPAASGSLTVERYAASAHVVVSRRGHLRDGVDEALAAHGLARRVVATFPTVSAALASAAGDDVMVAGGEATCRHLRLALGLVAFPLPVDADPAPLSIAWHQRYDDDPAHAWLRALVADAVTTVLEPPASAA